MLAGLVYDICEGYLDDCIIHGGDFKTFLTNLETVFGRFRKHNIKLNPKKCRLGAKEIEYVGHVLNKDGMTFSRDKIEKVLQIPKPIKEKELKSFLGLANYFRDHIENHSTIVRPLNDLLKGYQRTRKIQWTPEAEKAFEDIKDAINNCPQLFFLDYTEGLPIYLHTDASNYGIGAYLFQVVDGHERPIAFISKTLNEQQIKKWSTPEKEAYAIFYSLQKLEYLLRDAKFTLRTDHKNLTLPFLNNEQNARVKRWKLAIQQFDFNIEYIKGEENIVADHLSRLVPLTVDELGALEEITTPREIKRRIAKVHNSNAGHHGVDRTLEILLREHDPWPYKRSHVREFIRKCPCCQKQNVLKIKTFTRPFTLARYEPMECLNVDAIGPLQADEDGNQYTLVVIDCFTRFVELFATKSTDAKTAAHCIFSMTGRTGTPSQILSDNGTQFRNEVLRELSNLLGIEQWHTLAYSKEENGIVERANKEVMRHLRAVIFDRNIRNKWSRCLPLVQRILNATPHTGNLGVPN